MAGRFTFTAFSFSLFVVNDYREKHLWELQLRLKKKKKPPGTDADIRLRLFSVVVESVVNVIDAVVS